MKYLLAWLPARVAYFFGDITSRVLDGYANLADYLDAVDNSADSTVDPTINLMYHVYSWLMTLSCEIDEWGDTNLWEETRVFPNL